jgi:peptidoglycan hydrolase CwlO-like protein
VDLITKLTAIFNNPLQLFPEKDTSNEVELMKKTIIQLEKRIEELEGKVSRKNLKIKQLKKQINSIY